MQELTKTQKSLAFEMLMEMKQFGVGDWISEWDYTRMCLDMEVLADYATVGRKRVKGETVYNLLDCIKYVVWEFDTFASAPVGVVAPVAIPAWITPCVAGA